MSDSNRQKRGGRSEWFGTGVAVSGWVAALLMGLLNLPAAINSFNKELPSAAETTGLWVPIDKRFNGAWGMVSNCKVDPFEVGDLTESAPPTGHGLDLTLKFDGDQVSGEIISDGLRTGYIFPEVEMVGRASGSTADLRVFDWIDAKATTLAIINITRVGSNCLKFTTIRQNTDLLPATAFMARESNQEYKGIPRDSQLIKDVIKGLSNKTDKPAAAK